jgi:hypothetical protein
MMSLLLHDDLDAPEQHPLLEVILHLYPQIIRSRLGWIVAANELEVNGAQRLGWSRRPWSVGLDTQTTCELRDTKGRISLGVALGRSAARSYEGHTRSPSRQS